MTRKHTARILALLLLTASTAQAEAPASQFGFRGWPYRQRPACQETQPAETASPLPSAAPTVITTSRPYGGAAGFQKADRSARTALRMAERTGKPCVTDDPAGVIRLLEDASSAETEADIQRQLGALLRQPELRRQELLDTLDSWLRCMGNQRRMARELHLHYNTVCYRLQQLWMLLSVDPADPVKRLALETALYLYRYRRA